MTTCSDCRFFHECGCGIPAFPKGECDIKLCHVNCDDTCGDFEEVLNEKA